MSKRFRVLYIEDLRSVREGLNYLLSQYDHFEVIEQEVDPLNLPDFIDRYKPDVVILDLQLTPPRSTNQYNGFTLSKIISEHDQQIKLIAHSMYDSVENVNKFVEHGGHGFVSKKSGHKALVKAIEEVTSGKKYICPEISVNARNPDRFMRGDDELLKAQQDIFTKSEKKVLDKVAQGYSTKQIADQLQISEKTVETHRKHLFEKANVKNVAELIAFAYSHRIVMD